MSHFGFMLIAMAGNLLMIDFVRRGHHGERVPVLAPRASIRRIKTHFVQYLLLMVTTVIGSFIGVLGFYAACIGGALPCRRVMPLGRMLWPSGTSSRNRERSAAAVEAVDLWSKRRRRPLDARLGGPHGSVPQSARPCRNARSARAA